MADTWRDCTTYGSPYEEQIDDTGRYRHRPQLPPREDGLSFAGPWMPGPAPRIFGVIGATTLEQAEAVRINPMRILSRMACNTCGYFWQQPASTGACPRCRSGGTSCYDQEPCMAPKA